MKDKIHDLIQLQAYDDRIKKLTHQKMGGPIRIGQIDEELKANELAFQEDIHKLESLKKDRRKIEQEIQELDLKIEKSNIKLSNIKSNKEYQAALKEIEDIKKIKFSTEDEAIRIMEAMEDLEKKTLANKNSLIELKKRCEGEKGKIMAEMGSQDQELQELESHRLTFLEKVDGELLEKYLFLRERKGGKAISPVVGGICQTCHLGIPPQKFNELIKGSDLLTCPHCNRIIYWGDDQHFQKH